jgi:hypothetical protein
VSNGSPERAGRAAPAALVTAGALFLFPSFVIARPPVPRTASSKRAVAASASASCLAADELAFAQTSEQELFHQVLETETALVDGGFATVWLEGTPGRRGVRMQWLDRDGRFVFPPGGRLVTGKDLDHAYAVIAAAAGGGAYVAFEYANHAVLVQRFDATGQAQWTGEGIYLVDDGPYQFDAYPYLITDPAGGVFACVSFWDPAGWDIRCQRIDDSGARLWSGAGKSASGASPFDLRILPRGMVDGAGGIMVFWRNDRDPFTPSDLPMLIEGQRLSQDGLPLWGATPKILRTTNLAPASFFTDTIYQVVPDGSGGAILAFDDWTGTSDFNLDVMAQRVSSSGEVLWSEGVVVTGADGLQQQDQTIPTGDGGAIIAVYEGVSDTHSRLLIFRLGPDGKHVWPANGILASDVNAAALDYDSYGFYDGQVLRLAWTHQNAPATSDMDIVLATFASDGTRLGTAFLTRAPGAQYLQGIAPSPDGRTLLAVWDDRRKGTWDDVDIGGAFVRLDAPCPNGLFYTVAPCRLIDTRGGMSLASQQEANFTVAGACGVPSSAKAVAVNFTAVSPTGQGHLSAYAAQSFHPPTSVLNFRAGQTRANRAIVSVPFSGILSVSPVIAGGGSTHLIIDVCGYFE